MSILKVLRAGHPLLRGGSAPVDEDFLSSSEFEQLIRNMFETMRDYEGIGLAAPQVQKDVQLIVFEVSDSDRYEVDETTPPTVLVNPEITDTSETTELDWEGCLSLPELRGEVPRYEWIQVEAMDESGSKIEERFEGFTARVVQHEIDHLNGKLFPDRMNSMESLSFFEEYRRYHAGNKKSKSNPDQQELNLSND